MEEDSGKASEGRHTKWTKYQKNLKVVSDIDKWIKVS